MSNIARNLGLSSVFFHAFLGIGMIFASYWLVLSISTSVYAHPGRTDSSDGHTCRTNCTDWGLQGGEYHKHNPNGGYTTTSGVSYDKDGNAVGGSNNSTSQPTTAPTATPYPTAIPTSAPTSTPTTEPTLTPTNQPTEPVDEEEVLGETQESETDADPEEQDKQETTSESEDGEENDGVLGGLITMAAIGGGGYFAYKKIKNKRNTG